MSTDSMHRSAATVNPAWIEIDLSALAQNFRRVVSLVAPGVMSIASVKANAYGHGAVQCAGALLDAGADMLATGDFDEALAMKEAGIDAPILMFGGALPNGLLELSRSGLIPTVYDLAACQTLHKAAKERVAVYVKVDCGLGRLGVPLSEAFEFIEKILSMENLEVAGVYTHLPFSNAASMTRSEAGLATFDGLLTALSHAGINVPVSQGRASAAVLKGLADTSNAVCVGHLYYGLSPLAPGEANMDEFKPVMRAVRGRLIHVATHAASAEVAIAGQYGLPNALCTGVVPMGMQQGMRPSTPGVIASALIRGRRVPVLNVSLEHATLDLSAIETPRVGEVVTFVGESGGDRITLDEIATWRDASALDVTMTFSGRLPQLSQ